MFGTSLLEEYRRARDVLGLGRDQLLQLAGTSNEAISAPPEVEQRLLRGA